MLSIVLILSDTNFHTRTKGAIHQLISMIQREIVLKNLIPY